MRRRDNVVTDANGEVTADVMSIGSNEDKAHSQSDRTATPQNLNYMPAISCSKII